MPLKCADTLSTKSHAFNQRSAKRVRSFFFRFRDSFGHFLTLFLIFLSLLRHFFAMLRKIVAFTRPARMSAAISSDPFRIPTRPPNSTCWDWGGFEPRRHETFSSLGHMFNCAHPTSVPMAGKRQRDGRGRACLKGCRQHADTGAVLQDRVYPFTPLLSSNVMLVLELVQTWSGLTFGGGPVCPRITPELPAQRTNFLWSLGVVWSALLPCWKRSWLLPGQHKRVRDLLRSLSRRIPTRPQTPHVGMRWVWTTTARNLLIPWTHDISVPMAGKRQRDRRGRACLKGCRQHADTGAVLQDKVYPFTCQAPFAARSLKKVPTR